MGWAARSRRPGRHDRGDVLGQGSVGNNDRGGFEVYRASKSALNQLMRSFAARHADDPRTLLLMAPGWVQTDLGGLQYLHYRGQAVRW